MIILLSFSLHANAGADFTVQVSKNNEAYSLSVKPSPSHHFNLKAPSQAIKTTGKNSEPLNIKLEPSLGSVTLGPISSSCDVSIELYLCDDNNTYCIPQKKLLQCADIEKMNAVATGVENTSTSLTVKAQPVDDLFIFNEPELAIDQSQKTKKPILIDFFGAWCPPCNILDETVFNTKEFKNLKSSFIYLKLDADHPVSWDLKSKFNVKGYPTVVLANSQVEEISRIVGSRSAKSFIKEMKQALKYKNISFIDRKSRADAATSAEETWQFGEVFLRQEDYPTALKYFQLAAKNKTLNSREKDLLQFLPLSLMAKSTDKNLQTQSIDLLKVSLNNYPTEETFYDKISLLTKIAEDQSDEKLKMWINEQSLVVADLWLKDKKLLDKGDVSAAEIWSLKASALDELKKDSEAKSAYKMTAQAYLDLIKKENLNLESSRGYNIERIYAIYKSGDSELADSLYLQMQKYYPHEFTFYYNHAQMLKELKRKVPAMEKAELAYKYSYGDNRLRAVYLMAELESESGNKNKALSLIDEVIKTTPLPTNENIRTHRYVSRLKKLKDTISSQ